MNNLWKRHMANVLGKTTERRLLAFFVDDYGAIINKNIEQQNTFLQSGGFLATDRFSLLDSLECTHDIEALFEALNSHKDINGKCVAWTPLSVPANPDFVKIKDSDFTEYHYETIDKTFERTPGCEHVMKLEQEGIAGGFFMPQYHGREHVNVKLLMDALKTNNPNVRIAFEHESLYPFISNDGNIWSNQAYKSENDKDIPLYSDILSDGVNTFSKVYGYKPIHFNAPGERENNQLLKVLADSGIQYVETDKIKHNYLGFGKRKNEIHWNGERNRYGQRYVIRNCVFEPTSDNSDWAAYTYKQIEIAFKWKKAAVVSSHRVNFAGAIDESNRTRGLNELNRLIELVQRGFPDVEFVTSKDLFEILYTE